MRKILLLLSILTISACDDDDNDYTVRLQSTPGVQASNATAQITLFGFDRTVADGPATAVDQTFASISGIPADITLTWPSNPHTLIDVGFGPVDVSDGRYYLSVFVDIDGDGMICMGDYIQDFDQTPFRSFSDKPVSVTVINVEPQEIDFCQTLSQFGPKLQ